MPDPDTAQHAVGTVTSLWRYPVKSMLGEEIGDADVSDRGLLGDGAAWDVQITDPRVVAPVPAPPGQVEQGAF